MSETFFIGDTHFGHRNIINYSAKYRLREDGKPFETIEEHDEELVRRWNSVVGVKDKIFHVGDYCFGARNVDIASRLNGIKYLVAGNHDHYGTDAYLRYFKKVLGAVQFESCIITHIPVHPEQLNRFWMNIHGHLHHHVVKKVAHVIKRKTIQTDDGCMDCDYIEAVETPDWRYFNVSCEQINCTPIPYDLIVDRYAQHHKAE